MTLALWIPYIVAFSFQWAVAGVEVPSGKGDGSMAVYNYVDKKSDCLQGPAFLVPDGKGSNKYFCQVQ